MVKGITANDVNNNRPGVDTDDLFQLNLDGQQVTQKTAGSGVDDRVRTVIPRNALQGLPVHKVDLRVTDDLRLGGSRKATLILEVFNVFNHANYGSYATSLSATSAATTAAFGRPQQIDGNAYVPRQAQLGFRIAF